MNVISTFKNLDVALPSIVYKYRDWNNVDFRRVLTHHELYLASPADFDDPMDCNLREHFPSTKEDLYEFFMNDCNLKHPEWNRSRRRQYAHYWSKNSPMVNKRERDELLLETKKLHDKRFGVLSLALRNDNEYLWEHYADNHRGFCIGYDTRKLIESGLFGSGGAVKYNDVLPFIDFVKDDNLTKFEKNVFNKKRVPYSQEEEYRLTKSWSHDVEKEERVVTIPVECIVQIIVGKNAPEHIRKEIRSIQLKLYPNAVFMEL